MPATSFARHTLLPAAAFAAAIAVSSAAAAQRPESVKRSGEVTESVQVVSFDPKTRILVVKTTAGDTESMRVPEEFRNTANLKPGDRIRATYSVEAEISLVRAGQAAPKERETVLASRTGPGGLPHGQVASHVVVTGSVVSVDAAHHRLKLVSPHGGMVHDVSVETAKGRQLLGQLKPGDKVTAEITESLLVSTERD